MADRMTDEALRALASLDFNLRKDPDSRGGWFITAEGSNRADMVGPAADRERIARAMVAVPSLAAEVLELRTRVAEMEARHDTP